MNLNLSLLSMDWGCIYHTMTWITKLFVLKTLENDYRIFLVLFKDLEKGHSKLILRLFWCHFRFASISHKKCRMVQYNYQASIVFFGP